MSIPHKIIVILGPTASGKSELAVKLARKYNGEVVSADSRQVYKGLDIGSGKITKKEMRGIPHHCIDFISPKKVFSAGEYKQCAEKAIEDILSRGRMTIICGGTGFYIKAIVDNTVLPEIPPDWKLRKKLEKKSVSALFEMLKKLDPERAKNIDAKNPRRLMRAIEIAKALGNVPIFNNQLSISNKFSNPNFSISQDNTIYKILNTKYKFLQIGIKPPDEILKKNIAKRIKKMLADGLIKETKKLHEPVSKGGQGLSWKRINELGFEYRYPAMFLREQNPRRSDLRKIGKPDLVLAKTTLPNDLLEKMILENWHYAKRQMTWFKRDKKIEWLDTPYFNKAEKIIDRKLKNTHH